MRSGAIAKRNGIAVSPRLRRRQSMRRLGPRALLYAALLVGAVVMLFPLAWMVSTSLTSDAQLFSTPPQIIPSPAQLENYGRVVDLYPILTFLRNSLIVAVVSTSFQVLSSAMAAYAFGRMQFRVSNVLFLVYLATMMVPLPVIIAPLFIEMRYLGLVNSYPGLILPGIASAFGTFLLRQAFLTLPRELEEAAFVEGASHWTVFLRIVLPLSKASLATFGIFAFMASWNAFLWPLVVTNSLDLMTLPVGLSNLQGQYTTA